MKRPKKSKAPVTITLDKTDISGEFQHYLEARQGKPLNAGAAIGYVKAVIDQNVADEKLREGIFHDLQHYVAEHFWAGVYFAKTQPERVKISYKEQKPEKKESPHTYLG